MKFPAPRPFLTEQQQRPKNNGKCWLWRAQLVLWCQTLANALTKASLSRGNCLSSVGYTGSCWSMPSSNLGTPHPVSRIPNVRIKAAKILRKNGKVRSTRLYNWTGLALHAKWVIIKLFGLVFGEKFHPDKILPTGWRSRSRPLTLQEAEDWVIGSDFDPHWPFYFSTQQRWCRTSLQTAGLGSLSRWHRQHYDPSRLLTHSR